MTRQPKALNTLIHPKTSKMVQPQYRADGNEGRREITLHSLRRYVKTTISDLGFQNFSEYFIGHSGFTYWTKKEIKQGYFERLNHISLFLMCIS
jgi:hypothetical protein